MEHPSGLIASKAIMVMHTYVGAPQIKTNEGSATNCL